MSNLLGKKALVTGGSRGIGAGIVKKLAEGGADVGFTYRGHEDAASAVAKDVEAAGRRAIAIKADSTKPDCLTAAVDEAADFLGGIDIFVSSAGRLLFKPIDEFTIEDFDDIVSLDLRAAFVGSKAALQHMNEGGRIIFISSNIADYAALPTTSFYSMVKAGLDGLCKGMARDLGPRGITVNSVHPGPIDTDSNPQDGKYSQELKRLMATPRYGTPADVGALVAFLASANAGFITGSIHHVDNGFTA
ncbi:MAG: SDR family oxidoreductase [Desulfobacteraceae bacterium]|nr:MAG: SDR family oxidoreductase [Desulfobacteraceae bacterium]